MILDVMNVDRFVKGNNLKEVTSNLYFDESGKPNAEGLFSFEIFGNPGSPDRKQRMAYIALDGPYLHPHVYSLVNRIDRNISKIINGTDYYKYDEKTKFFVKAADDDQDPSVGTGLDFLYQYWDKLSWRRTASMKRDNRLDLLEMLKKDEAFMTKQLVIPAFYRDMSSGRDKINPVNSLYKKIINSVTVLNSLGKLSFTYNLSRAQVQNTLSEIYTYFTGLLRLKTGFLHGAVMSKSIDYGIRTLISAPTFSANSWKEMPADYEHVSVPLAQAISGGIIAVQAWIENWVNSIVQGRINMYIYDQATGKVELKNLAEDWKLDFQAEKIGKKIYQFVMTPEARFYPVTIKFDDGSYKPFAFINGDRNLVLDSGEIDTEKLKNVRYYTWTDVFYLAAEACVENKATYITRYPVTDHHSQYFAKAKVRSTFKTMKMLIGNTVYEKYPVVKLDTPANMIESLFIDSLEIFPVYLGTLGADHDGDMCSLRILYSYEANAWADNYVQSVANAIGISGESVRTSGDVGTHGLYGLLRDPND